MKKRTFIVLTITEAFPLNYSDPRWPTEHKRATAKGPHYAPGARWYEQPEYRAHFERRAAQIRSDGWTATVTEETR